jgi:hypothetical protein
VIEVWDEREAFELAADEGGVEKLVWVDVSKRDIESFDDLLDRGEEGRCSSVGSAVDDLEPERDLAQGVFDRLSSSSILGCLPIRSILSSRSSARCVFE